MLFIILALILLVIFIVFIIAPATIKIIYRRNGQNDYAALELLLLWNLLPIRLEITSLKGPAKIFQPFIKIKAKLTSKGKKPVACEKEAFSPSRLYQISLRSRYYFKLFRPALTYMANNTKLVKFRWETKLGFENSSTTGMFTGALWTVKGIFSGLLYRLMDRYENYPQLTINPVFNQKIFETQLNCIFEVRPGHIITTGLKILQLWLLNRMSPGSEQYARPAPD